MNSEHFILDSASNIDNSIPLINTTDLDQVDKGSSYYVYIIAALVLLVVLWIVKSRKAKNNRTQIVLVGERGAGKTQLFINLCGGKTFETVPSIVNNTGSIMIGRNKYTLNDFIGDNISKQKIVSEFARFHTIVHVIDGADSKKLGDAALFIYRMLINKQFQRQPCNYVIFLNKQDEKNFHGKQKLVKRIEDQIETIKVTRRNQPEQNEGEEDYLRNDRTRVDLVKQDIQIIVGSGKTNRKSLFQKLQEICG